MQERIYRTKAEWIALISECRASGKSDADWCREHGLSVSSFYNACSRLRKNACVIPKRIPENTISLTAKQDVVKVELIREEKNVELPAVSDMLKAPVMIAQEPLYIDNHHTIEVELNGAHIRVSNDVNPALLSKTISLLRSAIC